MIIGRKNDSQIPKKTAKNKNKILITLEFNKFITRILRLCFRVLGSELEIIPFQKNQVVWQLN